MGRTVQPRLSIVIPTYGGRASLEPLISRLADVLRERGVSHEVIVVNDASPDDTWALLQRLRASHPELRAIDLLHNHGQAVATLCGLAHASGALVATMDDDLQHPPEELPKLLDALERAPDQDAAVGQWPRDEGLARDFGSWVHATLDRVAHGTPRGYRHTTFRVMRRPVVDALLAHETRMPVMGPLLYSVTRRIVAVQVEHHQRTLGRSGFRFGAGVATVFSNFLGGTTLPLRLLARFGLFCAVVAACLGTFFVARWWLGYQTPVGWASLYVAITFFGGATLFGIGTLGEYTHLMLRELRRPPRWAIRGELAPPAGDTHWRGAQDDAPVGVSDHG